MKRISLIIIVCTCLPLTLFGYQADQALAKLVEEKVQHYLDSVYDPETDFGGATVGVVLPDDQVLEFAVGLSDIAAQTPMEPDHRMLGGSTGKIFLSASIMQLVETGEIALDDKLESYLGHHTWYQRLQNASKISIRNLLQHSSGLSRYILEPDFQVDLRKDPDRQWEPSELVSYVLDKDPLFEAGSAFAYSDTNYILLGMVLETVKRNSMYEYIDNHILKPGKLDRVSPQLSRRIEKLAVGYSSDDDPFYQGVVVENGIYKHNLQFEYGGGGFVNNARDLARAGKLIYENTFFKEELMEEFLNGISAEGLRGQWGLGVHINNSAIGTSYGHSGFFPGYISQMLYFPDHGFSIAFQVNTSDQSKLSIYRKLFRLIPLIANELKNKSKD
jgi:D-alanyl-D-alanine carboxypeptidase